MYKFFIALGLAILVAFVAGHFYGQIAYLILFSVAWAFAIAFVVFGKDPVVIEARAGTRKLYCVFSREALDKMNGIRGKLGAQAGHAFLHAWWDANERFGLDAEAYRHSQLAFKIVLVVDTDEQLRELHESYKDVCGVSLVTDAGLTVFDGPTLTCIGIGPILADDVKPDLSGLKTLR